MAMAGNNLTAQLYSKLNDPNALIDQVLEMAFTVFDSSEIPIVQKEEQILSWTVDSLAQCSDGGRKELLYSFLLKCFQSNRFLSYNGNMKSSVIEDILSILEVNTNFPENIKTIVRGCCSEIFCIPFFQRWFTCDPENLCRTTGNYFKSISDLKTACDFMSVIDSFLNIHKLSLLKADMRTRFLKNVLIPLCEALNCINESSRGIHFKKAVHFFREIVFYEPSFLEDYIKVSRSKDFEPADEVRSFRKKVRHLTRKQPKEIVQTYYSLFLSSVISKLPERHEEIFRVFLSLCPPLGINVDRIISIEMIPIENWNVDDSYEVIVRLIDILDESKIPLTFQLEEVTLQNWFTSLIIGLVNLNSKKFTKNFLSMVRRVYDFVPLVIEPSVKVLVIVMLQMKKAEVREAYTELLKSGVAGSSRLQRLPKFFSFLLQQSHDYLRSWSLESGLTLHDILPREVLAEVGEAMSGLPHMQVLTLLRTFIFHLEKDCIPNIDTSSSDSFSIVNTEIVCVLMTELLENANMLDHSVPETVKTKYKSQLEDLQALLRDMGVLFQEVHEDRLLSSFLKVCKSFGELKLLFREYDNLPLTAPTEVDLQPTNIAYVHNYLGPEEWRRIAGSLEQHAPSCKALHCFYELLIQKVRALSQVEEGSEGPGSQVARYLLARGDPAWLWEQLQLLASIFQSAELLKLVGKAVRYHGEDQSPWLPLIRKESFTENRQLVLGLAWHELRKASRGFLWRRGMQVEGEEEEEETGGVGRQLIAVLSPPLHLLEYELSQLLMDDVESKQNLDSAFTEMAQLLNENLPLFKEGSYNSEEEDLPHISVVEVACRLPLHHLSLVAQRFAVLAALALLSDLPSGCPHQLPLFNLLLKIFDGPQKDKFYLVQDLEMGTLIKFLGHCAGSYPGQRKLMKRLVSLALRDGGPALRRLLRQLSAPSPSDVWITALVVDCLAVLKKKVLGEEGERPVHRMKALTKLKGALTEVLTGDEPPSPRHLYSFSVAFSHSLRYRASSQEVLARLQPLLSSYIQFALADYKEGERLVECLVEHRSELGDEFPPGLILSAFQGLKSHPLPPQDSVSQLLFATATLQEFRAILEQLLNETKVVELRGDEALSGRLLTLWSQLLAGLLSSEKCRLLSEALLVLCRELSGCTALWPGGEARHLIPSVCALLATLARSNSVELRPTVVDAYLELCGAAIPQLGGETAPSSQAPSSLLLHSLLSPLAALHALFRYRSSLLGDRLPAFLQLYRGCLTSLPHLLSSSGATPEPPPACPPPPPQPSPGSLVQSALPVAAKLERLATMMAKKAKDFSRLSPYLIADIMNIYQHHKLPSEIKFSYENIVKAFLSISDKHAISYLRGVLPLAQQELFNQAYENYYKHHRFVGKI